jgi:hypothetical protein
MTDETTVDQPQGRELKDADDPAVKEGRAMQYGKRREGVGDTSPDGRPKDDGERKTRAHIVGPVSEFPDGSHRVVDIAGRQIGVFNIKGTFHALPNICPHQTGPRRPIGTPNG